MDTLRNAALDSDLGMIITTGAVYGIFLVLGDSWSELLRMSILHISPSHGHEILSAFIHAAAASCFSVGLLLFIVKSQTFMKHHGPNVTHQSKKLRLYLSKKRSRSDVAKGIR
jgi:hypothetical protein